MAEADLKVTKMVIKVDLQCCKCYKKIKKVLCHYPREIRDQIYDEKNNMVVIRVVCCSPECIKEKIICKAGDTVKSIEIIPDNPKEPEKPKPAEKPVEKPPKEAAKPPTPKRPMPAPDPPPKAPEPMVQGLPRPPPQGQVPMYPFRVCCCCCYCCGRGPTCYDGCGWPAYECQGCNRGCYMSRCDEYLSDDNATGCSVM